MNVPINCLHDLVLPVSQIREHPKNPNRHPTAQIALLAKVITSNGWRNPLVVSNQTGLLIRGHGRLLAAKQAGIETCPVSCQDYATEADELADMLADNRIAELAAMDNATILALVKELQDTGNEDFATGFTEVDIQNMILASPDPDAAQGRFVEADGPKRVSGSPLLLVINGRKYPLGDDEMKGLVAAADEYVGRFSNLNGFVACLLSKAPELADIPES